MAAAPSPGREGSFRGGRLALVVGLVVVLLGALWFVTRVGGDSEVPWTRVERRDLVLGVEVSGTLVAVDTQVVGPPSLARFWDFRISYLAPEGQTVQAGQPVLAFDPAELEQRLAERAAARDSAQKEIEKRRTDLAARRQENELKLAEARARFRKADLQLQVPEELVAAQELATQRIDREIAEKEIAHLEETLRLFERQAAAEISRLEQSRRRAADRVREIETMIERMTLRAPRPGIVIYTENWQGEKAKVGDNVWRGQQVLEIPDLARMRAEGTVDEADVGVLEAGLPVTLRLDAHPDVEYTGELTEIGRSVQERSPRDPVKVVDISIALGRTDTQRMRPGMRWRGRVITERIEGAVVVPTEAVLATPAGPRVLKKGLLGPEAIEPRLGRRTDRHVEVLAGLRVGDEVALGLPDGLDLEDLEDLEVQAPAPTAASTAAPTDGTSEEGAE